jgi:glycosyltransferase involved in cell wall biosynthesis
MRKDILLSIVIPCYNKEKYISRAIESAISEVEDCVEIIVLDNNSNDNSWDIIKTYSSHNLYIYQNTETLDLFSNWNKAFSLSKGKYVKFLPADDIHVSKNIGNALQCFKDPLVSIVIGSEAYIDENDRFLYNKRVSNSITSKIGLSVIYDWFTEYKHTWVNSLPYPTSIIFRSSSVRGVNGFSKKYKMIGDIDIIFRVAEQSKVCFVHYELGRVRINGDQEGVKLNSSYPWPNEIIQLLDNYRYIFDRKDFISINQSINGLSNWVELKASFKKHKIKAIFLIVKLLKNGGFITITVIKKKLEKRFFNA